MRKSASSDLDRMRVENEALPSPATFFERQSPQKSARASWEMADKEHRAAERRRLHELEKQRRASYLRRTPKVFPQSPPSFSQPPPSFEDRRLAQQATSLFDEAFEAAIAARPADLKAFLARHFARLASEASAAELKPAMSSTYKYVPPPPPPPEPAGARLYVCGQQTGSLNAQLTTFLGGRRLQQPVKAAMPPFNRRPDMTPLPTTVEFNAPVFGPQIANATMALFEGGEMAALADELGVRIPTYQISGFVQKKAVKVKTLVEVARARADCASGANAAAITKLDGFISAFEKLSAADVPNLEAWRAFVGTHCPKGWEGKLHFDHVLTYCFGFEQATAKALREHKHETKDPKTGEVEVKKLEEFSVRWLSKGLGAYGPVGCLGDAVNLVLAMLYDAEPADKSESALVDALMLMKHLLSEAAMGRPSALAALWRPTHLQHDCESDDTLAWLLLERMRRLLRSEPLRVLAQVGEDPRLDTLAAHLASKGNIVFRDADSRNVEAVLKNFAHLAPMKVTSA